MRKLIFSAISACLMATSASAWHWNEHHPVIPLEVAVGCAHSVGVYAPFHLSYPKVAGLKTIVVHEGPTVSKEQAALIGECIEYHGGLNATGQKTETVYVGGIFGVRSIKVRRERCNGPFVGGSDYCIKRPWY